MNKIEKEILNLYATDCSIGEISYSMMGKMLDERYVKERLQLFDIKEMYLYAGSYLAVQLYRAASKYISIKGIVDKNGKIPVSDNIPVFILDDLKKQYNGEKIVVTSVRYYLEIKKELEQFIESRNIIFIGELMFGIA